jgi:hypothetical protein
MTNSPFLTRVGILGCPVRPDVPWTSENLEKLKSLGFNTMQINIAWGYRPGDEALNLEDVVELPPGRQHLQSDIPVPVRSDPKPERQAQRKADLRQRIRLCKEAGLRTIFHFGAPNNAFYDPAMYATFGGQLPRCLLDGKTQEYYDCMLEQFAREFPGVDDLQIYTYDQDAWLCNEFGTCPHCSGVPLHQRVSPFINRMAAAWQSHNPGGRVWWEPWELSAGQTLKAIELLDPHGIGLALHVNIAEAQVTLPVDRWLKNMAFLAAQRGIPVTVEGFLGGASEEVEPYTHLSWPLVTLRMLRAIAGVPGVIGVKEYYGLLPDKEDPNLRITGLFLQNPEIEESQALEALARPYSPVSGEVIYFWRLCSQAMELFPWDASWFIREVGRSDPAHSMSAAFLRGYCAETPSWLSTRAAIFMKVDNSESHPWMLEDVQLRCELAADRMAKALDAGRAVLPQVPAELAGEFAECLRELVEFRRRALAYAYHLRETNLVTLLRAAGQRGEAYPARLVSELRQVLLADQANQGQVEPVGAALHMLDEDIPAFLSTYFLVEENKISKGYFSLTSR